MHTQGWLSCRTLDFTPACVYKCLVHTLPHDRDARAPRARPSRGPLLCTSNRERQPFRRRASSRARLRMASTLIPFTRRHSMNPCMPSHRHPLAGPARRPSWSHGRGRAVLLLALATVVCALPGWGAVGRAHAAAGPSWTVVMTGLDNPRGLAFGDDGA